MAEQLEQRTVRPFGPIASSVVEYLVAHSGQVSIMDFPIRLYIVAQTIMISKIEQENSHGPVIELEKVSKRYGREAEVFSDVSLTLAHKSFTFLTGASGAGKSTLLKLLQLSLQPSRGLIRLFGEDVLQLSQKDRQKLKRRIGVVSQDFGLIKHMNVFENACLPLIAAGQSISKNSDDVKELLSWVGLGEKLHVLPPTLSGGEAQRLAIARAVVNKPDILLADEPTGNVDPEMGQKLLRLFQEMNRTGTTVLIATHDAQLVKSLKADSFRIIDGTLKKGSIL